MKELGFVEEWVRTVAIPHLILGWSDIDPLPPRVDISVGHAGFAAAFETRVAACAVERSMTRAQAEAARAGLVETLVLDPSEPDVEVLRAWVDRLTDVEVLERQDRLGRQAAARNFSEVQPDRARTAVRGGSGESVRVTCRMPGG